MLRDLISQKGMPQEHCILIVLVVTDSLSHVVDEELGWGIALR